MKGASILAVGNVKGGVGKTTLAVNLAIGQALRGKDVLLVDGDEQGTARAFRQLRADILGTPGYTAVSLQGAEIRTQLRMLRTKYESVIVDVGGRDTASLRAALTVADMLIVPVLPATFDMWSLEPLDDLIQEAKEINSDLKVLALLNAADAQGRDNAEAAMIIGEKAGFEYFPHPIIRRKAFRNAAASGLSVLEYRPSDEKAVNEFTSLRACLQIHWRYRIYISCPSQRIRSERQRATTSKLRSLSWLRPKEHRKPMRMSVLSRHRSGFPKNCWNGSTGRQRRGA